MHTPNVHPDADRLLVHGVLAGQRRSLAKAITLIESTRPDHQQRAQQVLTALLPKLAMRYALAFPACRGGSLTFIQALGVWLIQQGKKLAVLAIDPSSSVTVIRSSATRRAWRCSPSAKRPSFVLADRQEVAGGVAEKTREAMPLCEAAGYDVIIIETVGAPPV